MTWFNIDLKDIVRVTEKTSLACLPLIGKDQAYEADEQAVLAMRASFQNLPYSFRIVIGEGERDEAPRLYSGELLGDSSSEVQLDVAVDPLEGTSLCAKNLAGALSVMALGPRGSLLMAPDVYMDKRACGSQAKGSLDFSLSVEEQIEAVAACLKKPIKDIRVGLLNRTRHEKLLNSIKKTQAKVTLVDDGDLSLAISTELDSLDLLMGSGGAPEGVLAAAALKCLGGDFKGKLIFRNQQEKDRASRLGLKQEDRDKIWNRDDLVKETCLFCASGVTTGSLLKGVEKTKTGFRVHSLVLTEGQQKRFSSDY